LVRLPAQTTDEPAAGLPLVRLPAQTTDEPAAGLPLVRLPDQAPPKLGPRRRVRHHFAAAAMICA
jgi:hypothetical protein